MTKSTQLDRTAARLSVQQTAWKALARYSVAFLIAFLGLDCEYTYVYSQESVSDTLNVRVESAKSSAIGQLQVLDKKRVVVQNETGKNTEFDRQDVIAITFEKPIFERRPSEPWIHLATGDVLRLSPKVIDEVNVVCRSSVYDRLPEFEIPLEFCRAISWSQSTDPIRQAINRHTLLKRTSDSDLVELRNGDKIEGEFLQLEKDGIQIETAIGTSKLPVSKVRSLVFNPELVSSPDPIDAFIAMTTSDGSTWNLRSITKEKQSLLAESICGFKFKLPVTTMVELRMFRKNVVALSSLPIAKQAVTKYLATGRSAQMDANVLGGRLVVGRRPFATGIGCMSGTTLEWTLPENASTFLTSVGLDQAAGSKGSVVFEVVVDGDVKWKSKRVTGNSPLLRLPAIDVSNSKSLVLKTHFDDRGHVLDYANWCNTVLLLD